MKALPTQFDDRRLTSAVATPTCSSCCCCCCCLATAIGSPTLIAQRIHAAGKENRVRFHDWYTLIAVLALPTAVGACWLLYDASRAGNVWYLAPVLFGAVLVWLYDRVGIYHPLRAAAITIGLVCAFATAELFVGAALLMSSLDLSDSGGSAAGALAYLIFIPIAVVLASVIYHFQLKKRSPSGKPSLPTDLPRPDLAPPGPLPGGSPPSVGLPPLESSSAPEQRTFLPDPEESLPDPEQPPERRDDDLR